MLHTTTANELNQYKEVDIMSAYINNCSKCVVCEKVIRPDELDKTLTCSMSCRYELANKQTK